MIYVFCIRYQKIWQKNLKLDQCSQLQCKPILVQFKNLISVMLTNSPLDSCSCLGELRHTVSLKFLKFCVISRIFCYFFQCCVISRIFCIFFHFVWFHEISVFFFILCVISRIFLPIFRVLCFLTKLVLLPSLTLTFWCSPLGLHSKKSIHSSL